MGCCQYFVSNPNELITLDREMEREKMRAMQIERNKKESSLFEDTLQKKHHQSQNIDVFDSVQKRYSIESSNDGLPSYLNVSLLNEINQIRNNPLSYIEKIEAFINRIEHDKIGDYVIINNNKINLKQGKDSFIKVKDILMKSNAIRNMQLKKDLCIPFPFDNINKCDNFDYLNNEFSQIKKKTSNKYKDFLFFCDKNVSNTEFVVIYNLLNATEEKKIIHNIILNEEYNVIGITSGKIDTNNNVYCYYFIFGKEKEDEF